MSILILAGDMTNYYLYKRLKESNYQVKLEGFSHLTENFPPKPIKIAGYKTIIAPIPFTLDSSTLYSPFSEESIYIDQLLTRADEEAVIIGGPFTLDDDRLFDLTKNRSFTNRTVTPTCEEIIKIIIDKSDITISGATIGLVGEGRISIKLKSMLIALGAEVLNIPDEEINSCNILVITTVDHLITDSTLEKYKDKLIIDITNTKHSKKTTKNILKARGLPGKSAPSAVADYIFDTLVKENILIQ